MLRPGEGAGRGAWWNPAARARVGDAPCPDDRRPRRSSRCRPGPAAPPGPCRPSPCPRPGRRSRPGGRWPPRLRLLLDRGRRRQRAGGDLPGAARGPAAGGAAGQAIAVLNRGRGGEEVQEMMLRLKRDVIDAAPTLVVWQVGANAALRGVPPAAFGARGGAGAGAASRRRGRGGADGRAGGPADGGGCRTAKPASRGAAAAIAAAAAVPLFSRNALMQGWQAAGPAECGGDRPGRAAPHRSRLWLRRGCPRRDHPRRRRAAPPTDRPHRRPPLSPTPRGDGAGPALGAEAIA